MIHFLLFMLYMKFFTNLVAAVFCITMDKTVGVVVHILFALVWGLCINSVYAINGSCHV